jgi:uncharacterized protein (TIGR02246 family)
MLRVFFVSLSLILVALPTSGEAGQPEAELRAIVTDLDARWNARDANSMSRLFTENTDFRIYGTRQYRGRHEFRQHYETAFAKMTPNVRHATTLETIRHIAPDMAVMDGEVTVTDSSDPNFQTRRYHYTALAIRGPDGWQFDVFRVAVKKLD